MKVLSAWFAAAFVLAPDPHALAEALASWFERSGGVENRLLTRAGGTYKAARPDWLTWAKLTPPLTAPLAI